MTPGHPTLGRGASCVVIGLAAAALAPAAAHGQAGNGPYLTPVTWERLLNAADEPENWLMYSGTLDGQRYSRLDQIHNRNVGGLVMKWAREIRGADRLQGTPLVVDGVMFVTGSANSVVALDAATGRPYWRYDHELPDDVRGRNNRGVAILGETLFMSTLDARLVAIDARTGNLLWSTEVAPYQSGYSKTAAPLIVRDRVVTGIAGGDYGIRGFLDSYDAGTGRLAWRTYTVPGPDHPDNRTWAGDSWRTGGSATWLTGSYDPDLDLVFWGTGNPAPIYDGTVRGGRNLYSDSVLALAGETGEMAWYFQFTPHDVHGWDANQIPVLGDVTREGETRRVVMWANRNAFFYTLDRETGEFLVGKPFALQTWAEGLDENGRPIRVPNMEPSVEGTLVAPASGATNWFSPTFSPRTRLFYVNAYDAEDIYFLREDEDFVEGERYVGGGKDRPPQLPNYRSAVRAIDPATGDVRWDFPIVLYSTSGLLSTAGDLVFGGTRAGYFFALDAVSGEELWHVAVGARVRAAPISYAVDGEQYVSIAAAGFIFTFGLDD